ncbi:MAG: hypothetical protein ABH828_01655 [archaeon]
MYDTQRVQKINAMSQELKKFGFAESSPEAIESAAGILLGEEERSQSAVFTNEEEVVVALSNNFRRFKDMTSTRMHEMSQQIVDLHGQIKKLVDTISVLERRNNLPPQQTSPQEPVNKGIDAKPRSQEEEKPYYEKQGKVKPADINIEDYFYFGNK